jgi:hypothetical protein
MGAAARADSIRFSIATVGCRWEQLFTELAAARGRLTTNRGAWPR